MKIHTRGAAALGGVLLTLVVPGFGMTALAAGGGVQGNLFAMGCLCILNLGGSIYRLRGAMSSRQGWPFVRLKYPALALTPWHGGLLGYYILLWCLIIVLDVLEMFPVTGLMQVGQASGIALVLGSMSGVWLALWTIFVGKKLKPVLALLQVAGLWIAVFQGTGPQLTSDIIPFVAMLLVSSMVVSPTYAIWMQRTRVREAVVLRETLAGATEDEFKQFISGKIMLNVGVVPTTLAWLGWGSMIFASESFDFEPGQLMPGLLVLLIGSLGNRLVTEANIHGSLTVNGIIVLAPVGCSFLWNWLFQGIGSTVVQFAGAALMAVCGIVMMVVDARKGKA